MYVRAITLVTPLKTRDVEYYVLFIASTENKGIFLNIIRLHSMIFP